MTALKVKVLKEILKCQAPVYHSWHLVYSGVEFYQCDSTLIIPYFITPLLYPYGRRVVSSASIRSWLELVGPSGHLQRMWSIVCSGSPQGHSALAMNPHLWRLSLVLPTLALFQVTQCFLMRVAPLGRLPLRLGRASLGEHNHNDEELSSVTIDSSDSEENETGII